MSGDSPKSNPSTGYDPKNDPEAMPSPLEVEIARLINPKGRADLALTERSSDQSDDESAESKDKRERKGGKNPPASRTKLRGRARTVVPADSSEAFTEDPENPETPEQRWARVLPFPWMLRYCLAVATLGVAGLACRKARVSRSTVSEWRGKCPEFAAALGEAEQDAIDAVESALRITATVGDPEPVFQSGRRVGTKRRKDSRAADILLRAKRPEEFRPDYQGAPTAQTLILASSEQVADVVRNLSPVLAAKTIAGRLVEQSDSVEALKAGNSDTSGN